MYDGSTSEATAILNGDKIIETQSVVWSPRPTENFQFQYVGAGTNNLNRAFVGNIATHMVWNRKLTNDEVLQNYNTLKGRFGK